MAIVKPVIFTSVHDAETTYGRTVSEETIRKMIQNCNLLGALSIPGQYRFVNLNQSGAGTPIADIFQAANGSAIVHPNSPLVGTTPVMTNHYVRGANGVLGSDNVYGGNSTTNLSHAHGTGVVCSVGKLCEEGNERRAWDFQCHDHIINNDLSGAEPLAPRCQQLAIYVKIN